MGDNENYSKFGPMAIVGIITLVLTIIAYTWSFEHSNSEWRIENSACVSEVKQTVQVLEERVNGIDKVVDNHSKAIQRIEQQNSKLQTQFAKIAEILSRLDNRTARLEEYLFSKDRDK